MTEQLHHRLILSLFRGAGLLDKAFEEAGFCVVCGPDLIWGGDIRRFSPPPGVFWGVIGGPPCPDFSGLRRTAPTGYGLEMIGEYLRVVTAATPEWWLMENVARVPTVSQPGYVTQRLDIDNGWFSDQSRRLRHIQFGSQTGRMLHIDRRGVRDGLEGAALASDRRSFEEVKRLQGLPPEYDLPPFKVAEKIRAVGNGVPLPMGRALAAAIIKTYSRPVTTQMSLSGQVTPVEKCRCGCGRQVTGKALYYDYSCRKRAQRKRDASSSHTPEGHR